MIVIGLDPGPENSAIVAFDGTKVLTHRKDTNRNVLDSLRLFESKESTLDTVLVIEQVAAMGMAVGAEVFETVFWSGRFAQIWPGEFHRLKRYEVKMHLCGNMRAKDANIRTALLDKFGGPTAVGRKATPGPLYGVSNDQWSALAIAVTFYERFHCEMRS